MTHGHGHGGWDAHAQSYDQAMAIAETGLSRISTALLDATKTTDGTRLLDLACGPGHTTAAAMARGAQALGIDSSPRMVDVARARFPHPTFLVGDMLAPPPGPWDAIVSRLGVHHADPAWAKAAFQVLRPGGRLAIAEKVPGSPADAANGMKPASHWVRLLEDSGFTAVGARMIPVALGSLAPGDMGHHGHFRDMLVTVVSGEKPDAPHAPGYQV